jgi:hypothetical protein
LQFSPGAMGKHKRGSSDDIANRKSVKNSPQRSKDGNSASRGEEPSPKRARQETLGSRNGEGQDTPSTTVGPKSSHKKINGDRNGVGSSSEPQSNSAISDSDIATLFSEDDRLFPGTKRDAMVASYASSTPYVLHNVI